MWIPERVWEQSLTRDLVDAGIEYTVLDDFHFKNAGLDESRPATATIVTEDDGQLLSVFPGSERLRYTIPFADPPETRSTTWRGIAEQHPDAVVVFGDDGEKFGTWPETNKHVYDDGWLVRFFDALVAEPDAGSKSPPWPRPIDNVAARRQDLSARQQLPRDDRMGACRPRSWWSTSAVRHDMEHDPRWPVLTRFVRGGFWRNFKVKYPEADEMYARMMMVSRRVGSGRAEAGAIGRPGRAGPQRALSRPVQLRLLARRVRRRLSAAPAQRRLSAR